MAQSIFYLDASKLIKLKIFKVTQTLLVTL